MDGRCEENVVRRLEQLLGQRFTLATPFSAFHLDSLDAVELSMNLEEFFGTRIKDVNFLDPYHDYTVQRLVNDICREVS